MVVSSARSFAARSPNAPPEKKKKKRRGFLSPLLRLYRKTRLAIRTSREKPPFLPRSLFLFSLNLSLALSERKDARVVSRKKTRPSVGRSRKKVALLEERGLCGCVYRKEFFSISPLKELESESFFCVSEESNVPLFFLSSCPPPPFKKYK